MSYLFVLNLVFALFHISSADFYIYPNIDNDLLIAAQTLGEKAKIMYIENIAGETDELKRKEFYLDGIEICNNIDSDKTHRIIERTNSAARPYDTMLLEQMGLKHFTAQFMTVPPNFMKEVVHMACSKHEQQLQCGSIFEGDEVTRRRIEDLKTIGNHRMMFDYECVNDTFVSREYPCVGTDVATWSAPCASLMEQYWEVKQSVNKEIASLYSLALGTVKKLKPRAGLQDLLQKFVLKDAMNKIATIEGDKCEVFKKMRSCVLPALESQCGKTASMAIDRSISMGYLRTERREKLHLDFTTFHYFEDPRCEGL